MKKLIAILAVVASVGVFAQEDHSQHIKQDGIKDMKKNNMMNEINSLTETQQKEFNEMKMAQMFKSKKIMSDIKEVNIQIQKEQLTEKPNQRKLGKLIDKKSKLQAQDQKDLIKFNIDVKEKFGIEMMGQMMMGDKNCKMMGQMKDVKDI